MKTITFYNTDKFLYIPHMDILWVKRGDLMVPMDSSCHQFDGDYGWISSEESWDKKFDGNGVLFDPKSVTSLFSRWACGAQVKFIDPPVTPVGHRKVPRPTHGVAHKESGYITAFGTAEQCRYWIADDWEKGVWEVVELEN